MRVPQPLQPAVASPQSGLYNSQPCQCSPGSGAAADNQTSGGGGSMGGGMGMGGSMGGGMGRGMAMGASNNPFLMNCMLQLLLLAADACCGCCFACNYCSLLQTPP